METGDLIDGRFRVVKPRIGAGGMAEVHHAVDLAQGERDVAIKVMNQMVEAERFLREAELLEQLRHPGVLRYVAHGSVQELNYLVTEWLPGQTLQQRLRQPGLNMAETCYVALRVADAMDFAHAHSVVHRDLKPSNLILPRAEIEAIKVIDFGISLPTDENTRFTATGMVLGTPSYMAPEQARGERDIDARVDVFALGCILYESLTGVLPFAGASALAVQLKTLLTTPPAPHERRPEIPPALGHLVMAMIAMDRESRPPTMKAVAEALQSIEFPQNTPRIRTGEQPTAAPVPATVLVRKAGRAACVVLANVPGTHLETDATMADAIFSALYDDIEAIARQVSGWCEPLSSGAFAVMISGNGLAAVAERAIKAASDIKRTASQLSVSIAEINMAAPGSALDKCARAAEAEARRAAVQTVVDGLAVRLGSSVASALPDDKRIRAVSKRFYLDLS